MVAELGVRFVGLLPVWRVIRRQYRPGAHVRAPASEAERLQGLVARAARRHWQPMRCLPQSLTLAWLLARRGIPVQLRIGVQRPDSDLQAHAWLETDGRCIGTLDGSYRMLSHGDVTLRIGDTGG